MTPGRVAHKVLSQGEIREPGMSDPRRQSHKQPPWVEERGRESRSFGGWLRRQREVRGIALRQIADTSKIAIRYLEALEHDQFDVLPAPIFAKGFLREYAKYVGLDPDEVINHYLVACQADQPEKPPLPVPATPYSTHWTYGLFLTLGVVVLFVGVAGLSFYAEKRREGSRGQPPPMAAPPIVRMVPPLPQEDPASDAPLRVTLDFIQNCWVEALVDRRPRISEVRAQGESVRLDAQEEVSLSLGNVAAVRVEVNGQPVDLQRLGTREGEPILIDLATVASLGGREN